MANEDITPIGNSGYASVGSQPVVSEHDITLNDGSVIPRSTIPPNTSPQDVSAYVAKVEAQKDQAYQAQAAQQERDAAMQSGKFHYNPMTVGNKIYTANGVYPNTNEGHVNAIQDHATVHGPVRAGGQIFSGSGQYADTPTGHVLANLDYGGGNVVAGIVKQAQDFFPNALGRENPYSVPNTAARVISDAYAYPVDAAINTYNAARESPLPGVSAGPGYKPVEGIAQQGREAIGAKELPQDASVGRQLAEATASTFLNPLGGEVKLATVVPRLAQSAIGTGAAYLGSKEGQAYLSPYLGQRGASLVGSAAGAVLPWVTKWGAGKMLPEPTGGAAAEPAAAAAEPARSPGWPVEGVREPTPSPPAAPSPPAEAPSITTDPQGWATQKLKEWPSTLTSAVIPAWIGHTLMGPEGLAGALSAPMFQPLVRAAGIKVGASPAYSGAADVARNIYNYGAPSFAQGAAATGNVVNQQAGPGAVPITQSPSVQVPTSVPYLRVPPDYTPATGGT